MKKSVVFFAVLLLFLCGCGAKNTELQEAMRFRTGLLSSGGCSYRCTVTADCGDALCEFAMDCTYRDGVGSFVLTAPEELSGIGAAVSEDGTALSFDGMQLALPDIADGRVVPLSVPWLLGSAWTADYITAAGKDGELCRMTVSHGYEDSELILDTWLKDGTPVRAEVSADGKTVLFCEICDFSRTSGKTVS